MNSRSMNLFAFAALAAMILACSSAPARALEMSANVLAIAKADSLQGCKLGHMVNARTHMNLTGCRRHFRA